MKKHYLVYFGVPDTHPYVDFVQGTSYGDAIRRYIANLWEGVAEFDGEGMLLRWERSVVEYSHPLEFIEARYKRYGEWNIREVPDWCWETEYTNVYVGDDPYSQGFLIQRCRKELRKEFPHSRASAFLWYLREGALVTFYRSKGRNKIEIIRRYLYSRSSGEVRPWNGGYRQLAEHLWVMPEWAALETE